MLRDHAPSLMRLIGREGVDNLKHEFCWKKLDPPACPPIAGKRMEIKENISFFSNKFF